jgi:glycosyltransferase involved in cell wall biosynthesis
VSTQPDDEVSVCLLTYKRERLLPRTLDTVLAQSWDRMEVVISDDCSPDGTAEVCRRYAERDPRVKYYRNGTNLRYAGNQNAALSRARNDLCAILHDGDLYHPELISRWRELMVRHPSAGIAFCATEDLDLNGALRRTNLHDYDEFVSGRSLLVEMLCRLDSPIFGIVMVRRSFVRSVGEFDPDFPVLADVDMWLRLLARYDAVYERRPSIQVSAREADHINNNRNAGVLSELDRLKRKNSDRTFGRWPAARRALIATHRRLLLGQALRGLRSATVRGEVGNVTSMLSFLARTAFALGSGQSIQKDGDLPGRE